MGHTQVAAERLLLIHISGGNREELIGQLEGFGYDVRNVDAIESAPFLNEQQKRDIFYNNAARFLRLSQEQIAAHGGN